MINSEVSKEQLQQQNQQIKEQNNLPYDFDDQIYLELNPDVANAGVDPRKHYLMHGKREGRKYNKTHKELEETRLKYNETLQYLEEIKKKYNQLDKKYKATETSLQKTQQQLEQAKFILHEAACETKMQTQYVIYLWEAWLAYNHGNYQAMAQYLKQSFSCSNLSSLETILDFLDRFMQLANSENNSLDIQNLTDSQEWKEVYLMALSQS